MKENNFETKMQELEKVVTLLEKGDMTLDESLAKFEEGMSFQGRITQFIEPVYKFC